MAEETKKSTTTTKKRTTTSKPKVEEPKPQLSIEEQMAQMMAMMAMKRAESLGRSGASYTDVWKAIQDLTCIYKQQKCDYLCLKYTVIGI